MSPANTTISFWGIQPKFRGWPLILRFCFTGIPNPYKCWKFCEKNFCPFLRKNLAKIKIFGVTGISHCQNFKKNSMIAALCVVQIWSGSVYSHLSFWAKNRFPLCPQWNGSLCIVFKWHKNSNNSFGWCWWYILINKVTIANCRTCSSGWHVICLLYLCGSWENFRWSSTGLSAVIF